MGQGSVLNQHGQLDSSAEPNLLEHLAILKSHSAGIVEGTLIRLSHIQQASITLGRRIQFELGGQYCLHRIVLQKILRIQQQER